MSEEKKPADDAVDPDGLLGDATEEPDDDGDDKAGEGDDAGADQLGDAGKKALDAMKARLKAERAARRTAEAALAEKNKPDEGEKPDVDAIRQQARDEARLEAVKDRALDKLEAKAARLFKNPEDARAFLASKVDDFVDGTSIDVEAITDALSELLTQRPYLGVTQGDEKRFKGTGDQGPKGSAGKPQLSRADVERMAREGKHAEIEKARVEGRIDKALGIT